MKRFLKYVFLFFCIVNAIALSICRIIPSINPFEQSFIGILGFLTPVFAIINLCFIFLWLITKKFYYAIIPVVALVFAWKVYSVTVAGKLFTKNNTSPNNSAISVMSYNIRLLDLYNWSGKKETRKNILTFIEKQNASVLCLQEFYTGNDSIGFDNIKAIQDSCHYPYYAECIINENKRGKWGSIIFSKLPIIKNYNYDIDVAGSNLLQQVNIVRNQDTFSIFNIHLKSNKFSKTENELVEKNEVKEWNEEVQNKTKSIYNKIEKSTINRGLESTLVNRIISKSKYKKIVCGDLNDIPSSYVYFQIRHKMKDAFLEKGIGIGATYNKVVPVLRIDYIFHDEKMKLQGFERIKVNYSDHYPLLAVFE